MTLRKISIICAALVFSASSMANIKVIYGEDNRLDVFEASDALHLELAKSTAAMISHKKLSKGAEGMTKIKGKTLKDRGICKEAKFSKQITVANCSGFLVGKDLLVTAGHCITSKRACEGSAWVFDYNLGDADSKANEVPTSSVYKCKEIISQSLERRTKDDYALIRLDREVTDREPLKVRTEGKVEDKTELVVIGHPTGLPTKIAAGAIVRGNKNDVYFVSNLDTFGGNSGSAVFDSQTGVVEGILVRGETDYTRDRANNCKTPKLCANDKCRGEDVTRITNITKLMDILSK